MLCQSCGQYPATTLVKEISDGQLTQLHLCDACAQKLGIGSMVGLRMGFDSFLGDLFDAQSPISAEKRCKGCGSSFREISQTGKVGCAQCYQTFRKELTPLIRQLHGTVQYKGKRPTGSALQVVPPIQPMVMVEPATVEEKRRELQQAVQAQEFERAAELRDEIKEMEQHG